MKQLEAARCRGAQGLAVCRPKEGSAVLGGLPGRGAEGACCAGPTQERGQGWGLLPGGGRGARGEGRREDKRTKGP